MKLTINQYGQFLKMVNTCLKETPTLRIGEAMFIILNMIHPTLAESIRATDCDPFYNDNTIDKFVQAILLDTIAAS